MTVLAAVTPAGAGNRRWCHDAAYQDGNGTDTIPPDQDHAKGASALISAHKVGETRHHVLPLENDGRGRIEQDAVRGPSVLGRPMSCGAWRAPARRGRRLRPAGHRAEQGVGFHPVASGSFLKSELVV